MPTVASASAARRLEARARARQRRVRVAVVSPARHYRTRSQSLPDTTYALTRTGAGWRCQCLGYRYTGACKHLGQLVRRAEREGWPFGRIAPAEVPATSDGAAHEPS